MSENNANLGVPTQGPAAHPPKISSENKIPVRVGIESTYQQIIPCRYDTNLKSTLSCFNILLLLQLSPACPF